MPGLTIVVSSADSERFHGALSLAAASAALDRRTRIFLQGEAVRLILSERPARLDEERELHGIPTLAELLGEARAMGVELILCQSGLALAGARADQLPEGIETGGLVELLASRDDDELLIA